MDDFVINVRQIGNYPNGFPQPDDLVLVQQGGLGGSYVSSTVYDLVVGALESSEGLSTNGFIEAPAFVARNPSTGQQGAMSYQQGAFFFDAQIVVPVDPAGPNQVTTMSWVQNNTVWSFNGRTGIVRLNANDVNGALGVSPSDPLATRSFVDAHICQSLQQFYSYSPLVFSFNGRVGDICLTLQDINNANFSVPGFYPQAPSPALGDASNNIATTMFVDESLADLQDTIGNNWAQALAGYAPIHSPQFTGVPTVPLPPAGSNDGTIPNTAWVMTKITGSVTGVASFNTRTGAVTLTLADVTGAGGAPINSPTFTGNPAAPTPTAGDSSTRIATTAFVTGSLTNTVSSFNTRTGAVTLTLGDITAAGGAPIASPVFTGAPISTTPPAADNTTRIATTAWVSSNAVNSFNGRTGAVTLQVNDITAAGGAPLNNPAFTGIPTVPTAAPGTNTTQAASTAFVTAAVSSVTAGVSSFNTRTGAVTFTSADLASVNGAVADNVVPTSGRLIVPGTPPSATLQFQPYNGANIKINGVIYPFSNTQALNNNCYLNGVANSALLPNTLYYVYMFWTGSTLALDFSTTGHGSSTQVGNYGVEVKGGTDNTRTFVGLIRTTATGAFDDSVNNRLCRSWFNRMSSPIRNASSMSHQVTTLSTYIALNNGSFSFVSLIDDSISLAWPGQMNSVGSAATAYTYSYLDGGSQNWAGNSSAYMAVSGANACAPLLWQEVLNEGYHTVQGVGYVLSGSVTYLGYITARLIAS